MLEFNPLYYKQKPSAKYHLIFFFCKFIIEFLSFRSCSTKGAALRTEPTRGDIVTTQREKYKTSRKRKIGKTTVFAIILSF